jgi:cytochrome c biogenesis protein ResB
MIRATLVMMLVVSTSGCAIRRRIDAYQSWATAICEEHHSVEACKPLPYPSTPPKTF